MKDTLFNSSKVMGANLAAFVFTFTGVIDGLKYLGILLGVCYTLWKWITDWKDRRERKYGTISKRQ